LGSAWFVKQLSLKNNDDEVMQALEKFHPAEEAFLDKWEKEFSI